MTCELEHIVQLCILIRLLYLCNFVNEAALHLINKYLRTFCFIIFTEKLWKVEYSYIHDLNWWKQHNAKQKHAN